MAYVYAIVVDDIVRYVGKGTGKRLLRHVQKMHQILRARAAGEVVRATHLHNRMARAWRNGSILEVITLIDGLTDDEAFAKEIEIIATYSTSQLWNKTLGGDKPPPRTESHTPERIERIRASNVKTWSDPQLREQQSQEKKVHWLNPEYREKVHGPQRGKSSPSRSAAATARWARPEFCEMMDQIHNDPSRKDERSNRTRRGWETRRAKAK